jgi:hypothetical protein
MKTWTKSGRAGTLSENNEKNDEMNHPVKLHEAWEDSCILDSGVSNTLVSSKMMAQGVTVELQPLTVFHLELAVVEKLVVFIPQSG